MLRALAGHICRYFEKPPQAISIAELTGLRPRLRIYLQERRFKASAIKAYVNFLRIFLRRAEKLGWRQHSPELPEAWQEILACISVVDGCRGIVHYATRRGIMPAEFADVDLDRWGDELVQVGRRFEYARNLKRRFRDCLLRAGLDCRFPKLTFTAPDPKGYGVPVSRLPDPLGTQLKALLE